MQRNTKEKCSKFTYFEPSCFLHMSGEAALPVVLPSCCEKATEWTRLADSQLASGFSPWAEAPHRPMAHKGH